MIGIPSPGRINGGQQRTRRSGNADPDPRRSLCDALTFPFGWTRVPRSYPLRPSRMKIGRCRRVFVRYPAKPGYAAT